MDNELFEDVTHFERWFTDEELDKLEVETGFTKTASDIFEKRKKEHDMLAAFKKTPSQDTFMPLYTSMKPLVMTAALRNMKGSTIPQAAHTAFAAQNFLDSIKTYEPSKGSFRTHAFNTVFEKGKRLNLKYQNIGMIPEHRATKYQVYQTALHLLREDLGREPSTIEIADECGMPVSQIETLRNEVKRDLIAQEHIVSKGLGFAQSDKAMQVARDVYHSLEPKHQVILEYTVGLNGKDPLVKPTGYSDIKAISKASGVSMAEVRNARKIFKKKFLDYRAFLGKNDNPEIIFDESVEE